MARRSTDLPVNGVQRRHQPAGIVANSSAGTDRRPPTLRASS